MFSIDLVLFFAIFTIISIYLQYIYMNWSLNYQYTFSHRDAILKMPPSFQLPAVVHHAYTGHLCQKPACISCSKVDILQVDYPWDAMSVGH